MKSMTGFGRAKTNSKTHSSQETATLASTVRAEVSARSVNGRFFEMRVHLPREWAELEPAIRTLAQEKVVRGTLDIQVNRITSFLKPPGTRPGALAKGVRVEVNEELAKKWSAALRQLAKVARTKDETVSLSMMAQVPQMIQIASDDDELTKESKASVLALVAQALDSLNKEREREGSALKKELLRILGDLEGTVQEIDRNATLAPADLTARFKARMDRLKEFGVQGPNPDDQRFHQEVALLIDRGDIREEITRLMAHIKRYRELITAKEVLPAQAKVRVAVKTADKVAAPTAAPAAVGKTLDFYAQELLREVNTIGSKSQTVELTKMVVEAKTLVEKIREQVQNIE